MIFTNVDFAPVMSSSLDPYVPKSFPADIPSSSSLPSNRSDFASDSGESKNESGTGTDADSTTLHPLYMDWDMDPNASTYEPPSSCMSPLALSHVLSASPSAYITLPLLLMPSCPPMLTKHTMPTESSNGTDTPNSGHFTCSKNTYSSSALSISAALDHTKAPIPNSKEKLGTEVA